jgi:hypothetical protein
MFRPFSRKISQIIILKYFKCIVRSVGRFFCIPKNYSAQFSSMQKNINIVFIKSISYVLACLMQIIRARAGRKEETTMKTEISRKTAYIGAGAGLVLFALFGLLPGSLLGGAAGINIAGWLFGLPLNPGLLSRIIVLAFMLIGVLVAGIVIVTASTTVGWLVGKVLEPKAQAGGHAEEAKAVHR